MLKKEVFKIEDSNVAGLGSDMDKKCRVDAAATEKAWSKAGKKPGMQVWRIEQFQVVASKTAIGTFYNDDSYICLNTYKCLDENGKQTDKLGWDIHFWLGATTSQDEYGTAAYKTVELDDFMGGGPVQHREVSGHESRQFLDYFAELGGIRLLEGGVESGFNHVTPTTYVPRLLHLKGKKNIRVHEVPIEMKSLNEGDVFLLDNGLSLFQWQGSKSGMNEKARAGQLCRALDDERNGKPEVTVFRQGDDDEKEFFGFFGDYDADAPINPEAGDDQEWEKASEKALFKLSNESGSLEFTELATGTIKRSMLNSTDVFIVDVGCKVFVYVGAEASPEEKKGSMDYAGKYLTLKGRPAFLPISKISEGADNAVFKASFDKE